MKNIFHLFLAAFVLQAQGGAADDLECRTAHRQAISACARSLDLLALDARAGAQKACVDGAVLTRGYCMSGIDECLDNCQRSYENSVAACEATFDPADCGGGAACEAIILQQADNCVSNVVSVLDSCSAACSQ
jgi:hypothetical protein